MSDPIAELLREAEAVLRFYADAENWKCPRDERGGYRQAPAHDQGRAARELLARWGRS